MNTNLIAFREPELEFRYDQRLTHPRDGLTLFGPFDADQPSSPRGIQYILIGTNEGISEFEAWAALANAPVVAASNQDYRIWMPFPGYEAAFGSPWPNQPIWKYTIKPEEIDLACRKADPYQRAFSSVDLYLEGLRRAGKLDERLSVGICVVPDEVFENCRPESVVMAPTGPKISRRERLKRESGQLSMLDEYSPEQYQLSPDFRRQLKARSMEFGLPLQIIRQSTLRLTDAATRADRQLTPLSDRMWNLFTTIYYKAGGKPWRLVSARDGVCYIGIAFRRTKPDQDSTTACCAAQMFLNTGDGVVFLGEFGPWYSQKTKDFQLSRDAAKNLLSGVLRTYTELEGKALTEVFLHSRSWISPEAFEGFKEACPPNVKLVGIRARSTLRGPRLFRDGKMPVIRGTFWRVSETDGYLWCSGFDSRARTYIGSEVPRPLRIDIQHGNASIERVAQDILGLTKLNYNACRNGDSQPVTIGFSDAVGEILISNPSVENRKSNFKFYI